MAVYLLAALDTKGAEADFVRQQLELLGVTCVLVDVGCLAPASVPADIPREAVFQAAGFSAAAMAAGGRARAVDAAASGAARLAADHFVRQELSGILALGGSAGTAIGTAAMRALPLGVPKLMVSTLASGQVRQFVGDKDILMLNAVVDLAGLNRISRGVLATAARAMAGMVLLPANAPAQDNRPLVAATMFGVTTACVEHARAVLEQAGYEVLVFHATGNGGRAMEALVREGALAGVLDITTTELADELVGGFLTAGPDRLTAAAQAGVPQVVSVGATDMVNFYARTSVPARFQHRQLHAHNAHVTLMRTTVEENERIGAEIGRKVAASRGPIAVFLPGRGVSALDAVGQPFCDPVARQALFDSLTRAAGSVAVVELDLHINDREFAEAAARRLIELMHGSHARPAAGSSHGAR
jgi:uncharacterized protein (UPF0261 family)